MFKIALHSSIKREVFILPTIGFEKHSNSITLSFWFLCFGLHLWLMRVVKNPPEISWTNQIQAVDTRAELPAGTEGAVCFVRSENVLLTFLYGMWIQPTSASLKDSKEPETKTFPVEMVSSLESVKNPVEGQIVYPIDDPHGHTYKRMCNQWIPCGVFAKLS